MSLNHRVVDLLRFICTGSYISLSGYTYIILIDQCLTCAVCNTVNTHQEDPSVQILDLIIPKTATGVLIFSIKMICTKATGVGGSEAHRRFPW